MGMANRQDGTAKGESMTSREFELGQRISELEKENADLSEYCSQLLTRVAGREKANKHLSDALSDMVNKRDALVAELKVCILEHR